MKKRIAILALLFAAGGAAYAYMQWSAGHEDARLTLYGNVDIREVQLGFRVAGRLQTMLYEEGDPVTAGTLLATLDDEPLREALVVAQARVREAQARLDRSITGSRPQEIQQTRARVEEAESALENAQRELKRQQELTTKGLSSQTLLDRTITTHDQAEARLAANKEALALAVEGSRQEDIAAAQATVAAVVAQREQFQTQLKDAELYAPSTGIIMTRAREPGSMVSVGAPVYTLSLTDTVYVRAYVDEPHLGLVAPGNSVIVHTDTGDRRYPGQIGFISPRAEFTPKTVETPALRTDLVYRLRIVVRDADDGLRQGMPVTVEFPED